MSCAEIEPLICDYVDGALGPAERQRVERHLEACPSCAALARDAAAAVSFMARAAQVEPPPELVTRLLFQIPSRIADTATPAGGLLGRLGARLRPVLQPRFAMGMAMTILSFSMLGRFAGISPRQLTPADLHPAKVWQALDDRAHRAWERARKFYLSLRVVYEIQTQLREWSQLLQEEEARSERPGGPSAEPEPSRDPGSRGPSVAPPEGAPSSQGNRSP